MQHVVELNRCHEATINYPHHCLPKYLHQPNAAEVFVPLWYQDDSRPDALLRKVTLAEDGVYQVNDYLPL